MPISGIAMTTTLHLPDAGSYVEMTASDGQASRVHVLNAEGRGLTLSAPLVAVPPVGAPVTLRWSAAPRGRYALTCSIVEVDENRLQVEALAAPLVEQQRHFVRGGGGEQVIMHRTGFPEASGWIRDISEHSMRAHFEGTNVRDGESLRLQIALGTEMIEMAATSSKVAALPQQVPPGPMSVELVAIFVADEAQARVVRRYILRQQLLSRSRA
jgi:hypothetical protein